MATGIWTKHLDINGRVYYYNAAQSRSVWFPPKDAAIHEAVNLSIPESINNIENNNNNININTDNSPTDKIVDDVDIFINQISNSILGSETNDNTNNNTISYADVNITTTDTFTTNNASSYQSIPIANPLANINVPSSSAIEDRIQQALTNTKQQFKQTQANKRFKSNETNGSVISDYERQRNELEAMMGSKRDEGGKWLVR